MELMKGVHRIPANANSYLLVDDKVLLFDTTIEPDAKPILDYLPKARLQPKDVQCIVLTHTHPDHANGLHTLKARAPAARVAAHEADADYISKAKPNYPGPPVNGGVSPWQGAPVDDRLQDGQRYEGLRVIHCPGHTPGSIALLDEERGLLIAGDTLRTEGGLDAMWDQYNIDPKQHREGIRKLARFDFEALVCGHGDPILRGAGAQVKALAQRL